MSFVTNVAHLAILGTCCTLAFFVFDGSLFSYHPVFMSLAYIVFMSEAVIFATAFRKLDGEDRVHAIRNHMKLQIGAISCAVVGFGAIFYNKILHGKAHFQSYHGKLGLFTVVMSSVAPLAGLFSFKSLGMFDKLPPFLQPRIKWWHRTIGGLTLAASILTVELGLIHPSVDKGVVTMGWRIAVAVIGVCIASMISKKHPKMKGGDETCLPT
ncbi:hypothetical protein BSKO_10448 [Bryopsis sp. KO-2023]|nr:hypothetical protein BSKO_10448 [Bryopsis sp. KO-2023]